jgi:hypothetical protein
MHPLKPADIATMVTIIDKGLWLILLPGRTAIFRGLLSSLNGAAVDVSEIHRKTHARFWLVNEASFPRNHL